jgi:precorrin-2 dehydrogenase/sirohydrochlorin ferrochelatase
MKYYPVLMDVSRKTCLVVGGGSVGSRKAVGLVRAGAKVRVVSPEMAPRLEAAVLEDPDGALELIKRPFEPKDIEGMGLVFAATDNVLLNAEVRETCARANVLCNAADGEDKGDFILPAVVARGDLLIAVSTCGASPALAKRLRKDLEEGFGPEYGELAGLLARVRKRLLARGHDPAGHKKILTALVEKDLAPMIAARDYSTLNEILYQVLGEGFSWDDLTA